MTNTFFAKLASFLTFFVPRPFMDYYAFRVWRSGLFDRNFYRGVNRGVNPIYRAFPIRHYVRFGENIGWQPNPDFSPEAYKRLNPDLADPQVLPLLHYIRFGKKEGRLIKDISSGPRADDISIADLRSLAALAPKVPSRFAVHAHIYYHELWDDFSRKLVDLDIPFDLFVTITRFGEKTDALRAEILEQFPTATVVFMPNHGRDIFPFVHLVSSGLLSRYEAVCKVHTKKSPHRKDGDIWRDALISGLLRGKDTSAYLDRFLADPMASLWVADGQHYDDPIWWGSNLAVADSLLRRVEMVADKDRLSFAAGSMYWLKQELVATMRGLSLTATDFEQEYGQVDGTVAHAFERALGYMAEDGGHRIVQTSQLEEMAPVETAPRPDYVSAFYLPQFHRVPENDEWWGQGYTEWVAVSAAKPNYDFHHHPQLPGRFGFYDLRQTEVLGDQAELAKEMGIDAFCTYFYWFDGKRILESPIDRLLKRPDVDFPFYLCWANESWRRNWDGLTGEVLLDQGYADGFEEKLANDTAVYMRDPRYQRPDGTRPRFVIYRPEDVPDAKASIARLRDAWRTCGIGEVELGAVLFHVEGEHQFDPDLLDFWVEMPPHNLVTPEQYLLGGPADTELDLHPVTGFSGLIYDYRGVVANSNSPAYTDKLPHNTIAGVMPSWDNTARRGASGHIAWGSNPMTFDAWMAQTCTHRLPKSYRTELFVNSWNEWAEKAMLEPSRQYGDAYLRVLAKWSKT
ncbi:glycoside hydrolase family 99-like domain-containing protein [Litoreibacter halocynthiae]|uniref:glycoside hydrolase family 99-like domain-containing protein n=1 Tax=Litoreibacter halocynthiae TaxID=1242689 RepID=UPI0024932EAB|nr:glycoside hydrolase family 99-like domain-containing protein [Litoreibacter halocynthiae]